MENLDPKKDITLFAKTNFRGKEVPFGIKTDDRRRHMYIIGKTGMGKTTMMENMIIQDIHAGRGIAFVDPHGDSVEKILQYIPSRRVNDVIYINPADLDFPIAFNILESVDPRYKHLVASGLMGVFTKIFADQWSARMEYILNNTVLALLESPGNTLLGIMRMLIDRKYRKRIVDNVKDPMVRSFWTDEYANWSEKYRTEAIAAIQNKIGQFLSTSLVRNIIGQPKSTIDLREAMDNKKILLLNLSKGRLGEDNSALLGAMIITKLQLAALSRVDIPEEQREDFYLYVDEFQNFATKSFATILSEARKYRLNLIIGHQYIGQLVQSDKNTEVRDAVFGNVGSIVSFRVGAADAEFLEKEFFPTFVQNDLVNLPKHTIILRLMINGVASDPFTATTLPPSTYQKTENLEKVIRISRERYANPSAEVEEKIFRWMGQDYHEQVAVVAAGSTAPEVVELAAADIDKPLIQAENLRVSAPEISVQSEPQLRQETAAQEPPAQMAMSAAAELEPEPVPAPKQMPKVEPVQPKIQAEPKHSKNASHFGPTHSNSRQNNGNSGHFIERRNPQRRKVQQQKHDNPIWNRVADLSTQKIKEGKQRSKNLIDQLQNFESASGQEHAPTQPTRTHEKAEQQKSEPIVLKPGEAVKFE